MDFQLTPDVAQAAAIASADDLRTKGFHVEVEKSAWPHAPLRTTLCARQGEMCVLVEAQKDLNYSDLLRELVRDMVLNRYYGSLFLATYHDSEMKTGVISNLQKDGVGLLVLDASGSISCAFKARNYALVVKPDPTLKFGAYKNEVMAAVDKFNNSDRKDGLRDMCEIVERETENLAVAVAKKGMFLTLNETRIRSNGFDWASQINALESGANYQPGKNPVIDTNFKNDLQSFRGARNLIDHKVVGKKAEMRRQKQYAERMMQGPRLLADLIQIKRRLR